MFDFEQSFEPIGLGARAAPASYAVTCDTPKTRSRGSIKVRNREKRRQAAAELAELGSAEAAALEAQLGVAPRELPPHLRAYALQRRNEACFSGPGVLPGEREAGHVEYKLRLLDPTPSRFQQLVTQLNWRLSEGGGECLYALGVEDNGHPRGLADPDLRTSLEVLAAMAAEVGAEAEVLQTPPGSGEGRRCAVARVTRAAAPALSFLDLRVAVAGGVDSGKSTLVGVLCHGAGGGPLLDNGRGSARMRVFRHKHECESGRTSSVSLQHCCYDPAGAVLNYSGLSSLTPAEAAASAARMLRFSDLAGHERFTKTLLHGLTAQLPHHVLLCVSAVAGVSWATREHLAVALALGIPLAVAVTKADLAGEAAAAAVAGDLRSLLAAAVRRVGGAVDDVAALAPLVRSEAQAVALAAGAHRSRVGAPGAGLCVPLFLTSAVTGASLPLLHAFFAALPPATAAAGDEAGCARRAGADACDGMQGWCLQQPGSDAQAQPAHFQIDGSFDVPDVGTVYSGTVVAGSLAIGSELLLGPLEGGTFGAVRVTGIHRSKVDVRAAHQGQHATVAVQPVGDDGSAGDSASSDASPPDSPPSRADSAGCLRAWMRQGGGTPALAIGRASDAAGRAPVSSLTAQLSGSTPRHSLSASASERQLGSSPQPPSAGSGAAPRPRKAAVLLDPCLAPAACTEFEAVLVLLGGHWPPRGLLSGRYPPEGEADEPDPALGPAGGSCGAFDAAPGVASLPSGASDGDGMAGGSPGTARSLGSGRLHRAASRRRAGAYTPVVHCGSIRQATQVLAVAELPLTPAPGAPGAAGWEGEAGVEELLAGLVLLGEPGDEQRPRPQAVDTGALAGAVAAAGVLQPGALPPAAGGDASAGSASVAGTSSGSPAGGSSSGGAGTPVALAPAPASPAAHASPGLRLAAALERTRSLLAGDDVGCLAAVTFRFLHQPEWLVEGARLIVRDRTTGRVAGAGYVSAVRPEPRPA